MIYGVYSIRDVKTGFMIPTIEQSDAAAARNFSHAVFHSDGVLRSYYQDFSLYRIGDFDTDSALLSPVQPPLLVVSGYDAFQSLLKKGDSDAF